MFREVEIIFSPCDQVYLVGGGPSLAGFDFNRLSDEKTIAINKAALVVPNPNAIYFNDNRFYRWYKDRIDSLSYPVQKWSSTWHAQYDKEVKVVKRGVVDGLSRDPEWISHGNNSGYGAINLAFLMGARNINLLGYDMGYSGDKTHFHEGYADKTQPMPEKLYEQRFMPHFKSIAEELKAEGVSVTLWGNSRLTCFPKKSLSDLDI